VIAFILGSLGTLIAGVIVLAALFAFFGTRKPE